MVHRFKKNCLNNLGLIFSVFHSAVVLDVCNFDLNETELLKHKS